MLPILFFLMTVVPAAELYLLFAVGGEIGWAETIALVVLTGLVGAPLAKSQGLTVLHRIQQTLGQGTLPTDEILHGLLIFGGGLLLLTPGFLTDILGLAMVFPLTRPLMVAGLKAWFMRAIANGSIRVQTFGVPRRPAKDQMPETFEVDCQEIHKD